ncbi:hypothetical protein O3M35_001280 [Rhynocoris fuscipes]|uniref:Protein kintoun n=1 Tax=Rhynocoris fuscipes TaxID=488301 RepID=A0AAW1DTJ5_9HEMI
MALNDPLDDIDITKEELKDIKDAFKREEFRNMLTSYFEEVNDPKNIAQYQEEMIQFEKDRGVDITFINPEDGYVIKSSADGKQKIFINICSNDKVGKPSSSARIENGSRGLDWSIPFLQGKPRTDLDKKNELCSVFDVIFHPDTLYLAKKDERIKKLVDDTALSAVEDSFKVKIDRKNLIFPKIKYKGRKIAPVIRKRRDDYVENTEEDENDIMSGCPYPYGIPPKEHTPKPTVPRGNYDDDKELYAIPHYIVKHKRDFDMQEFRYSKDAKIHAAIPSELVVEIDLPLVKSTADVNLDVIDKSLSLISEKPAKYKLNISLPYSVDDENGNAKFDCKKKKLIVTLPVIKRDIPKDFIREDSGIESDVNHNNCSSSEEDIRKNIEVLHVSESNEVSEGDQVETDSIIITSEEIKTEFLRQDIHYSFPNNSVTIKDNQLSFRVIVRNIDPQSIAHKFLEGSKGVHIKFSSLGAGFFPVYYAFCLSIPAAKMDTTSLKIDVWDNYLLSTLNLDIDDDTKITSYFVGITPDDVEEKSLVNPTEEISNSNVELEDSITNAAPEDDNSNKIVHTSSDEASNSLEENKSSIIKNKDLAKESPSLSTNDFTAIKSDKHLIHSPLKSPLKCRTLSESHEIPESFERTRRSILKGSRSLSESHTDDYNTWSSIDSESHDDLSANKKTVRFSEVVSKKIFRANSSILGQRKKNEKKSRNRKKAAYERMLSSAGSEESETDREECDSVSELSDVSSDDSSSSGNGTNRSVNTVVPSSKNHRRRGAKNQRKAAAAAKHNHLHD